MKRRDNKGRVLRNCEYQRTDGKYEFKYMDKNGERKSVYSWRLVNTDKVPIGKRNCEPLRDIEKRLVRDIDDGIDTYKANKITLNEYYDEYIRTKLELKQTTLASYRYVYNRYIKDDLGRMKLCDIKYSDIKKFYLSLINVRRLKPNTINIVYTLLHPIFNVAVRDDILRTNPTNGVLNEIKRSSNWQTPKRHALTIQQQKMLMDFVRNTKTYKKWYVMFTVMLGTGARIGEICGLRWDDCDFTNNMIEINHNLAYISYNNDGTTTPSITTPKTSSGVRVIPMFSNVREVLIAEYERQKLTGFNKTEIDGYTNFIFTNRDGGVFRSNSVNNAITRMVKDFNEQEMNTARLENREPILLPHFSCHILRHTFCTRLCESKVDIKMIQEIMGHSNITTTMNIYNDVTTENKINTFANLDKDFTTLITTK